MILLIKLIIFKRYFEDSRISQLNLDALKNIKNLKSL